MQMSLSTRGVMRSDDVLRLARIAAAAASARLWLLLWDAAVEGE